MGYNTEFSGKFEFDRKVAKEHADILLEIAADAQDWKGAPDSYCQWVLNLLSTALQWDGDEKFYFYVEWLEYLIKHVIEPFGYKLNGSVTWRGEDIGDLGCIVVTDNKVRVKAGRVVYEGDD